MPVARIETLPNVYSYLSFPVYPDFLDERYSNAAKSLDLHH
jgi:hypothetical protein